MDTRAKATTAAEDPPPNSDGRPLNPLSFYEDEAVLAAYGQVRERGDGPKKTVEEPTVMRFLGDLGGRRILDLGCGDARLGGEAMRRGARSYLGLDGSQRMVELARETLSKTGGEVRLQNLETWEGEHGRRFDVVVSQLALQYVTNLPRVYEVVGRQLDPGEVFVFSVEHPIITSSYEAGADAGIAAERRVRHYFREGSRVHHWLDAAVVKQHRTLQTYIEGLLRCGFCLEQFSEGRPDAEMFADPSVYEQRLEIPICAVFKARLGR